MRKSPEVSTVTPFRNPAVSFDRRALASFSGHLTCLMLFRHGETETKVFVSDDGDAVGAVWLPKALLVIDRTDRGRFLVVTISQKLAFENRLAAPILDRAPFTPEERADLEDAITTAYRARKRLSGREDPLPFPGRNAFA